MIIMVLRRTHQILEKVMKISMGPTADLTMIFMTHSKSFPAHLGVLNLASKMVEAVTAMEKEYFTNRASHQKHIIAPSLKTQRSNPTSFFFTQTGVSLASELSQYGQG